MVVNVNRYNTHKYKLLNLIKVFIKLIQLFNLGTTHHNISKTSGKSEMVRGCKSVCVMIIIFRLHNTYHTLSKKLGMKTVILETKHFML